MASFSENSNLTFNPYIQQVPIDDYMRVGLYKQQAYDTNLQKIDEAYSNTAGLDIIQNSQRNYLNETMNNVKNELKKYGSADFSNQQLTNSLIGMVGKVQKDPIIQNAVSSTINYRKAIADRDEARKKGLSAPENEDLLNSIAEKWLNGDVNSSFNYSFETYTDVGKKAYDIFKAVVGDSYAQDIPFEIGPDGQPTQKMAIAMERVTKGGVSVDKLKAALKAGLDEKDYRQLYISGRYRFKNYTQDDLKKYVDNKYIEQKATYQGMLEALEKQKTLSVNNPDLFTKLSGSIEAIKSYLAPGGILDRQHEQHLNFVLNNPDEAKGEIYKDAFINEFANANSYEKSVLEYVKSPFTEHQEWEASHKLEVDKLNSLNNYRNAQLQLEREKNQLLKEKNELDKIKIFGYSQNLPTSTLPTSTKIKGAYEAMSEDVVNLKSNFLNGVSDLANKYNQMNPNAKITPNDILSQIELMQNSENPTLHFPPNLMGTVNELVKTKNKMDVLSKGKEKIEKEIDAELAPQMEENNNNLKKFYQKYNLPEYLQIKGKNYSIEDVLTTFGKLKNHNLNFNEIDNQILQNVDENLKRKLMAVPYNEFTSLYSKNFDLKTKKVEMLNNRVGENYKNYVPNLTGITTPTKDSRALYETLLSNIVARMQGPKGADENFNPDEVGKLLETEQGRNSIDYKVLNQAGQNPVLFIQSGNKTYSAQLTPQEAQTLPPSLRGNEDMSVRDVVSMTGNLSTNPYFNNPNTAFFQSNAFPKIENMNVKGDLLSTGNINDNMYYPMLHWNVPGVGQRHIIAGSPIDWRNAEQFFSSIDGDLLRKFFLKYGDTETKKALSKNK